MRASCLVLVWAFATYAQNPPVPADYADLYPALQQKLTAFDATIASQWNGAKPPVDFSAELLAANANRGTQLLGPNALTGVGLELQSLEALGVNTVKVAINFPILYQPFTQYNGDPADYQYFLAFYRQVAADIRALGLRMVVHTGPLYTGDFAAGSGLNAGGYYKTLSSAAYIAARARQIITIAQQIQPDYLVVAQEPDNEAALTGLSNLGTAAGFSSMVDTFLTQLDGAGLTGTNIGAGVGTWLANALDFLKALAAKPRLDFIDLHVYPVNAGLLDTTAALIDQAEAAGKPVTITSAWLEKRRDSEYPASNIAADPAVFARDPFSFWAPLDQQFLTELVKLAWWKQLTLVSPYWSEYFEAYVTYNSLTAAMSYGQIRDSASQAASLAIESNQYTSTGLAWQNLVKIPVTLPSLVSAANPQVRPVAPDSIVSVFGANLAGAALSAPSFPLPTQLGGTTLTFIDQAGSPAPASLYFVSASQVNAVVPTGLPAGPVTFQIANSTGTATLAAVAPSLFSSNDNGRGPAAALVSRLHADGTGAIEPTVFCTIGAGTCTNAQIDLSSATDQVSLELFGTGIRGRGALSDVRVSVGGILVTPTYAGAQPQYPGMDQVNIPLPRSLAGRGELNIDLSIAGRHANLVTIAVK
jgi:uncharacterized protein (TIGR03437 family)